MCHTSNGYLNNRLGGSTFIFQYPVLINRRKLRRDRGRGSCHGPCILKSRLKTHNLFTYLLMHLREFSRRSNDSICYECGHSGGVYLSYRTILIIIRRPPQCGVSTLGPEKGSMECVPDRTRLDIIGLSTDRGILWCSGQNPFLVQNVRRHRGLRRFPNPSKMTYLFIHNLFINIYTCK